MNHLAAGTPQMTKQTGQILLMAHECYYDSLFQGTPYTEFQTEHFPIVSTVFFPPHLEYDFERNSTSLAWLSSAEGVTFLLKYLESNYKLIVNHLIKSGYSIHPAGNITTQYINIATICSASKWYLHAITSVHWTAHKWCVDWSI